MIPRTHLICLKTLKSYACCQIELFSTENELFLNKLMLTGNVSIFSNQILLQCNNKNRHLKIIFWNLGKAYKQPLKHKYGHLKEFRIRNLLSVCIVSL